MEKIKFGIVGCGRISGKHIEAIKSLNDAEITAVCDTVNKKAKAAAKQADAPFYVYYDEMLKKEKVDVVSILTPSGMHPLHTIDIVNKYRKNIICEKPMALHIDDADDMIKACDENGVHLFIVKQNRFNLPVMKLKEALIENKFGKLVLGTVRVRWCRTQKYYDMDDWRGT